MADFLTDLFQQNQWANLAMIDRCRELSDEQLDDESTIGVYGSIRATLHHIVSAEAAYAFRLGDETVELLASDDPWPGFDRLSEYVRGANASLAQTAHAIPDTPITSRDGRYLMDPEAILIQAIHHAADHRSQINTVLTQLGLEPQDHSSWGWGLAEGRMREAGE